jgi:peptidoglycan/xylan/chitin deacetylase (PgdA/CDA1 family)
MKKKYIVTAVFVGLLIITVFLMIKVEDKLREEKIIVIDSTKVRVKLLPDHSQLSLAESSQKSRINFRVKEDYFQYLKVDKSLPDGEKWEPFFLKGVNLGVALPGKFPSEFPTDFDLYLEWFEQIGQMNSNVVRIYTILPPQFYEALANYNLIYSDKPLYLMQGVWATVPEDHDYFNEDYTYTFQKEIKDVIDVIHGDALLDAVPGKASGTYVSDVSRFTVAYLLGREWEPKGVTHTNLKHQISSFQGDFISVPTGNAMEMWLGEMLDFSLKYETLAYQNQHPVSFVNWLPLDPMFHNSEFIENEKVREYDNDLEIIDFRNFHYTALTQTGIYAAYHAYPYYPDFIFMDEKYTKNGDDNFLPYLQDLKLSCPEMPLIIAEYGVPSSRGNSHYSPFGFDQGGHNEEDQARINRLLTQDIHDADCGGAIMFEWLDEWFKFNWMVMDFEQPQHRRKYWHNKENPEQNFGVVAVENRSRLIDGTDDEWPKTAKYSDQMEAAADPSYFYLRYQLSDFDFSQNNLYIAIDTYDKNKGDHTIPFVDQPSKRGIEFVLTFHSPDSARILVDDYYSVYSDIYIDYVPVYTSLENNNGYFVDQELLSNRERETLTGKKQRRIIHNRSKLEHGTISENSNTDWFLNQENGILELRLPWHLLNVSDPSSLQVLDDIEGTPEIESSTTDGFRIWSFITDQNDNILHSIPKQKKEFFYQWDGWDEPVYETRLKEQYYVLQKQFAQLKPKLELPKEEANNSFSLTPWFQDSPGAISITFDDGSYGQYEYAFPTLQKYKVKADFSVVGEWTAEEPVSTAEEDVFSMKRMGWIQLREMSEQGNEISSHGFLHQRIDETKPSDEIAEALKKNRELIQQQLGESVFTLHYPYSYSRKKIVEAAKEAGFLFGRVGDNGKANNSTASLYNLNSKVILNNNDPDPVTLNNWIEAAKGSWLLLNYHHIFQENSKEMELYRYHEVYNQYAVTPRNFDNQIRLLRNSGYWIATTSQVGKYLRARESVKLIQNLTFNSYVLTLQSDLDSEVYDQPLTVEFTTNWEIVKISHSEKDGIYNTRNGKVLFPAVLNKKIIIERIK